MTSGLASRMLPFGVGPTGAIRLLCLPHAGAGASAYRTWGAGLSPDIAVCPVQLPGRESLVFEQPYRDFRPLIAELADELSEAIRQPYAVFGHSLGAVLAFELVREIRRQGGPAPRHLFVSGRQAPHQPTAPPDLRDLATPDLARELIALGGTPSEVLADLGLLDSIAPLLRADFSVNETYVYTPGPPLDVDITAFASTADSRADRAGVDAWREHTSGQFQLYLLPGGHFAVLKEAPFVHQRMKAVLSCDV